jgi:adenylate cyclase
MATRQPFELLEDPAELALCEGWSEEVYRDISAVAAGTMPPADFDAKYLVRRSILVLDLTGFTETTLRGGALPSLVRILDGRKFIIPVLREYGAVFIRTFADDVVGIFEDPERAVDAALEIQRRSKLLHGLDPKRAECCIGVGYGDAYAIGPNHAMGDEMNRASKLGEDTARGGEILVTEHVRDALQGRSELSIERQTSDDLLFPYFRITEAD